MTKDSFARIRNQQSNRIGGWLVLPAIYLILMPLEEIHFVVFELLKSLRAHFSYGLCSDTPFLTLFWIYELVGEVIFIVFLGTAAYYFFQKKRLTRRLMVLLYIFNFLFTTGAIFLAHLSYKHHLMSPSFDPQKPHFFATLAMVIWVPYFIKSKRVKRTFVN